MLESVIALRFVRWVDRTRWVSHFGCLFQKSPADLAELMVTMESCSDRSPRGSGLCVLFHADQFLVIGMGPRTSRIKRRIKWWSDSSGMKDMHMWGRRSCWIGSQCKRRCFGSCLCSMCISDVLSGRNLTIGVIRIHVA